MTMTVRPNDRVGGEEDKFRENEGKIFDEIKKTKQKNNTFKELMLPSIRRSKASWTSNSFSASKALIK